MRQRYFHLTGNSFYPIERQLRLGQIIALRFAGDEELANLIEQTILKKIKPEGNQTSDKRLAGRLPKSLTKFFIQNCHAN